MNHSWRCWRRCWRCSSTPRVNLRRRKPAAWSAQLTAPHHSPIASPALCPIHTPCGSRALAPRPPLADTVNRVQKAFLRPFLLLHLTFLKLPGSPGIPWLAHALRSAGAVCDGVSGAIFASGWPFDRFILATGARRTQARGTLKITWAANAYCRIFVPVNRLRTQCVAGAPKTLSSVRLGIPPRSARIALNLATRRLGAARFAHDADRLPRG